MIIIRNFYILLIELVFGLISGFMYVGAFLVTPIIEFVAFHLLKRNNIMLNGNRPWDIRIKNRKVYRWGAAYGTLGVLESYFEGFWECDDLETTTLILAKSGLLHVGLAFLQHRRLYMYLRWNVLNSQTRQRGAKNCNVQYNLGKDFFSMFLDKETLSYSIAYWGNNAQNLQEATYHKMELICQKLDLKPGMRVLDLGCGFGGLSKYMATKYKVHVVGITNSVEMFKGAKEACAGIPNIQIKLTDYRDLPTNEKFDRIVTIEMLFHVGKQNIPRLFQITNDLLEKNGLLVVQDFLTAKGFPSGEEAIHKYLFPGVYVPHMEQLLTYSNKYFTINNFQDLSADMDKTFHVWYEALEKNWNYESTLYNNNLLKVMQFLCIAGGGIIKARLFTTYHAVFQKRPEESFELQFEDDSEFKV